MPGPSDLIDNLQDEEAFSSAEDFQDHAKRQINRAASRHLSPSQQERLNFSFDTEDGSDDQLLMQKYDLLDERDQYRFENFAGRDEVQVVSTNMEWTEGNSRLLYFVMYHVPPGLYDRMRRPQVEDPSLHPIPPASQNDSPPARGRFEWLGYRMDQWIARASAWLSGWF